VVLLTLLLLAFAGVSQAALTTGTVPIHNNTFAHYAINTTGSLAFKFAPAQPVVIQEIRFKLSASGGAGSFTAALDNGTTSTLDVVFITEDMTSASNILQTYPMPLVLKSTDAIDFAYPNANNKTYGLEVVWRRL